MARTFAMSSLLRIFPEADLGTLFMNVTLLNLLKGATCNRVKKEEYMIIDVTRITQLPGVNHFCTLYYKGSKQEIWFRKKKQDQSKTNIIDNGICWIIRHYLVCLEMLYCYDILCHITWLAINFWTSSSVSELLGDRTTYAIGTSPASASGNLLRGKRIKISVVNLQDKHKFKNWLYNLRNNNSI